MKRVFSTLLLSIAGLSAAIPAPGAPVAASGPVGWPLETQGFTQNVGQVGGPARYFAVGQSSAVYFEPTSVLLDRSPGSSRERGVVLRVEFPATDRPRLEAGEPQETRVNAFLGRNPSRWRAGAPSVREVRYQGIAPGTDVVYRMANGRLKYDVVLSPGADLSKAVLRYRGAESLSLDRNGELVVHTAAAELREEPPYLYQDVAGRRVTVTGGYRILSDSEFGFWASGYDPALPLVVDPGLMWSTFTGGNVTDYLHAAATDQNGDVYIVGMTTSTNYPTTTGSYQRTKAAGKDVVVTKLRSDGSGYVWSTYLGGNGDDEAYDVAVDGGGNVYVCGYTYSTDFPVTAGAFRTTFVGGHTDGFVTKLSPSGSTLAYSTYLGGTSDETPWGIAVSGTGNAFVAGNTGSSDFPTTAGVVRRFFSPNFLNAADGFLTQLNAAGTGLVYSTFIGSDGGSDGVNALALDATGLPVVVGGTLSPDFPTTTGAFDRSHDSDWDCFVSKLNSGGTAYLFSTFLGGVNDDEAYGVAVDGSGYVYVTGRTASAGFPVSAAAQGSYGGGYDAFLTKLNPTGTGLSYSTFLGGSGYDEGKSVAVSTGGQACLTGTTQGAGFPVTSGAFQPSPGGGWDGFVTALTATGSALAYSSLLGGGNSEAAHGIALKPNGQAVVVGFTDSGNYPTTGGAIDRSQNSAGMYDGFIAGIDLGLGQPVAVGDSPPARLELAGPTPNPFSSQTEVLLSLGVPSQVAARVVDVQGRLIRDLADAEFSPGSHRLIWDGRDDVGRDVGPGLYLMEVVVDGRRSAMRMVRLL